MDTADLIWAGWAVAAITLLIRARRSVVEQPLPAAMTAGALFGLAASVLGLSVIAQAMVAAVAGVGLGVMLWRWRVLAAQNHLPTGVGGRRLVGMNGEVVEPVGPGGRGSIRLGTEVWLATTVAEDHLAVGTTVTVLSVEGIHLVVSPVSDHANNNNRGS